MSYTAIAREKAVLVERTGLLGEGMFGSQVVSRFFIGGFGTAAQRDACQSRVVSVAISEPRVGAHPKLLTTHAEPHGDGFRITGEKAWVTNGPLADVFIVLAITSVEARRKQYSMFLVARDTPGLSIDDAEQYRALAPSRHCGVKLDDCYVPSSALLGSLGAAYEAMALPFRDVEDAVGMFGLLGAFRFMLSRLTLGGEAAVSLGGLIGLTAVFAEAASAVVAALDADNLAGQAPTSIGLRVLAGEMLQRARAHREAFGPADEPTLDRVFADLDTALSVARGPRQVRQARLGSGKAA